MHFKLVTITPKAATDYLKRNTLNRPLDIKLVKKYAHDMKRGNWRQSGDTLQFASGGELLEGQHRLSAIVMADIPQQMLCVFDVDPGVMPVLGTGKSRTASDVVAMHGITNSKLVSSAARLQHFYEKGLFGRTIYAGRGSAGGTGAGQDKNPTNSDIIDVVERNKGLVDSAHFTAGITPVVKKLIPASLITFLHFQWTQKYNPDDVHAFFAIIAEKMPTTETNAANVLRRKLTENMLSRNRLNRVDQVALVIKAFTAFRKGIDVKVLRYSPATEAFPEL